MRLYTKKLIEKRMISAKEGQCIDLSKEILSIEDYEWLSQIIEKGSFLEILKLPRLTKENMEKALSVLNQATKKNSTLLQINILLPEFDGEMPEQVNLYYAQIQSRLHRNKNRIFGIHGGGNIGLGLMADIISKSPFKYEIVATSNDPFLTNLVNSSNRLCLQHKSKTNANQATRVENVRMISRNSTETIELYRTANIVAICLTPVVISQVANDIAKGLIKRYRTDGSGLKILVLMNIPKCHQFVREKIAKEIQNVIQNIDETNVILSSVEFIPTVVDRIVTKIDEKEIKDQFKNQLLESKEFDFIASKKRIKEQVDILLSTPDKLSEAIVTFNLQFNLFNAEKNFVLYVPEEFVEAIRFPAVKIIKNLEILEAFKNKYINGPHAILAWLGALSGCRTVAEAINYPGMLQFIEKMMTVEIAPALKAEYPDLTDEELNFQRKLFIERCMESSDDSVIRVGRDPLRKIDACGRIRGTIELSHKHQLMNSTVRLEHGIAAAILYAVKEIDPSNPGCKRILEIFKQNDCNYESILCYQGPSPSGVYKGFDPDKDRKLIDGILTKIHVLEKAYDANLKKKNHLSTGLLTLQPQNRQSRHLISTSNIFHLIQSYYEKSESLEIKKNVLVLAKKTLNITPDLKDSKSALITKEESTKYLSGIFSRDVHKKGINQHNDDKLISNQQKMFKH